MALIDNLVSYWKLDGNSTDSVGSNNGTDTSITYGTAYGKINQGADFNGTTSHIEMSGSGTLDITGNNISISCWFNLDTIPASGNIMTFVGHYVSDPSLTPSYGGYDLRIHNNSGTPEFDFVIHTGSTAPMVTYIYTPSTGTWYHLVTTNDGTTLRLYLNGTEVASATGGSIGSASSRPFNIGCLNRASTIGNERFVDGKIDEVGIWNRTLSASEVSELYNSGNGLSYPFTSTIVARRGLIMSM